MNTKSITKQEYISHFAVSEQCLLDLIEALWASGIKLSNASNVVDNYCSILRARSDSLSEIKEIR